MRTLKSKHFICKEYTIERNSEYKSPTNNLEALDLSIEKWKFVVRCMKKRNALIEEGGQNTCALCELYFDRHCLDCPIMDKTEFIHCNETPYREYTWEYDHDDFDCALAAAEDEVKFLQTIKKEY